MINRDRMLFLQGEIEHKQALILNTEKTLSRTPDDDTFINQLWRLEDEKERLEKELSEFKEKKNGNETKQSAKAGRSKKLGSHSSKSARIKPKKSRK